jgi:hypothetical protein
MLFWVYLQWLTRRACWPDRKKYQMIRLIDAV